MIDELCAGRLWLLLLVQGTACLAAGLAASYVLRHRPAHAHQILLTALWAAVLMPGLYLSAQRLGLGVLAPRAAPPAREIVEAQPPDSALRVEFVPTPDVYEPTTAPSAESVAAGPGYPVAPRHIPWGAVTIACWLAATLVLLTRLALRFLLGFRLLRAADPVETEQVGHAIEEARSRLGIDAAVRVRHSERVRSPVIWCWVWEPVLLLHPAAGDREGTNWVGVFCHKLAHWRRRDHLSGLFAELLVAVFPWHPLLWWARGRLLKLSEQACDDWVLATGQSGVDYAELLLGLAAERQMAFLPTVIGKEKTMHTRIRRIIQDNGSDPRLGTRWTMVVGALALCTSVGVAVAQRRPAPSEPMEPPPQKEFQERRELEVREIEVREPPAVDQERIAVKRLLEQLMKQADEKKEMLREGNDLSEEERQIQQIELKLLVEQIEQMKSRLETVGRAPAPMPHRGPTEPDVEARFDSLRQRYDELVQRAQKMERQLEGLTDGQDQEAGELKLRLKEVHAEMVDVEKRMEELKRSQAESKQARAEPGVERDRRSAMQADREAEQRQRTVAALQEQLRIQMAQIEQQLRERKERGEGDSPESRELSELLRMLKERLREREDMPAPQKRPAVTRDERRIPEGDTGKTEVRVFKLRQANPQRVRNALQPVLGRSGQIAVDERTNSLIVTTTPENMARVEDAIRRFDAPAGNRNRDAEVEELRSQMRGLSEQMQQIQKRLDQIAEQDGAGKASGASDRIQEYKIQY
jgi:beta-lactamase regulating signal transducer with metallopeptidase domain